MAIHSRVVSYSVSDESWLYTTWQQRRWRKERRKGRVEKEEGKKKVEEAEEEGEVEFAAAVTSNAQPPDSKDQVCHNLKVPGAPGKKCAIQLLYGARCTG